MNGGALWGCVHVCTGWAFTLTVNAQGGCTQVFPYMAGPLPSPGIPEYLCGPYEGWLSGGECDPPLVRKPSQMIQEVCLGVLDPLAGRLCLCLLYGSAAIVTCLQRTLLRFPLDGVKVGRVRVLPATAVVAECGLFVYCGPCLPLLSRGRIPLGRAWCPSRLGCGCQ